MPTLYSNKTTSLTRKEIIFENLRIMGKTRSVSWLFKKAEKGFFKGVNSLNALDFCTILDRYITILKGRYGSNWDIKLIPTHDGQVVLGIIIHYPKIDLTNSREEKHTIRNLLVYFNLEIDYNEDDELVLFPEEIEGTKYRYSAKEASQGYVHSHLYLTTCDNIDAVLNTDAFCLGSGEITDYMALLSQHRDHNLFEMFLLNLDTMVSWESIEGVPYNYINKIEGGSPGHGPNSDSCEVAYDLVVNYIKEGGRLNYTLDKGIYCIKRDQLLYDTLKELVIKNISVSLLHYYLQTVDSVMGTVTFFRQERAEKEVPLFPKRRLISEKEEEVPYFYIQGRKLTLTFDKSKDKADPYAFHVAPTIIDYVEQKFKNEIYEKAVRKSSIERAS